MKRILDVQKATKRYKTKKDSIVAIDNISFHASCGEIVGLLGPNGSGKTTTIKSIAGLMKLDSGEVLINGLDNYQFRSSALQILGAVLEGNRNIYWRLTPFENIRYFAGIRGLSLHKCKQMAEHLIEFLGIKEFRHREVRNLSRGQKQKVAIACSLAHDPLLILMDEPTLGLDVQMIKDMELWIRSLVRETGKCLLITSHDLKFIENVCDRVVIIDKGHVKSELCVTELNRALSTEKIMTITAQGYLADSEIEILLKGQKFEYQRKSYSTDLIFKKYSLGALHKVVKAVEDNHINITNISMSDENLEEIFLRITK